MEAFNASGPKPISLLPCKASKPKAAFPIPAIPQNNPSINPQNLICTSSNFLQAVSPVLLSSFLDPKLGFALTYEEALEQSMNSSSGGGSFGDVFSFAAENPLVIGGGLAVSAVPLIVSQLLGKSKPFGVESARSAFAKLGGDPGAQLLDIRSLKDFREVGSPDIRGLKKKPVSIVYSGDDKPGFLKKLGLKFKEPEDTTLFILDKFDGNSELVAELVTVNGFKAAYAIKDGAEGSRGWMNSGLPWMLPKKALSLGFSSLAESITTSFPDGSEALPIILGLAAATGAGLLAFTEIETLLQLLGSAAVIQLLTKKLLFAGDRKRTLQQVDEFLNTRVAPKELVSDLKEIGATLLPSPVSTKALPVVSESAVQPTAGTDSSPRTEPKVESHLGSKTKRALSPYPHYPDLKPPSSPWPSPP